MFDKFKKEWNRPLNENDPYDCNHSKFITGLLACVVAAGIITFTIIKIWG